MARPSPVFTLADPRTERGSEMVSRGGRQIMRIKSALLLRRRGGLHGRRGGDGARWAGKVQGGRGAHLEENRTPLRRTTVLQFATRDSYAIDDIDVFVTFLIQLMHLEGSILFKNNSTNVF